MITGFFIRLRQKEGYRIKEHHKVVGTYLYQIVNFVRRFVSTQYV